MGGCYTYHEERREPSWRQGVTSLLNAYFRTHELADLVEAHKEFSAQNRSGFIQALLAHRGVDAAIKEFPAHEYELKLRIDPARAANARAKDEPGIAQYLAAFDFPAVRHARFLKDAVDAIAEGNNHFFGDGLEERLVVIEKGGKTYLKEKSQPLPHQHGIPYEELVLKRSEERHEASMEEILAKAAAAARDGASYQGFARKEKGDAFILDTDDGRIYSFTVTRAHKGERVQRQLELEYAGYIPGFPAHERDDEARIIEGLVDLARYTVALHQDARLPGGWRLRLAPTNERKYDFVRGANVAHAATALAPTPLPSPLLATIEPARRKKR